MSDRSLAPFDVEYLSAVSHEHQRYLDCGGSDYFSGWLTRRSAALEARIEALEKKHRGFRAEIETYRVVLAAIRDGVPDAQESARNGLHFGEEAALRSEEER